MRVVFNLTSFPFAHKKLKNIDTVKKQMRDDPQLREQVLSLARTVQKGI